LFWKYFVDTRSEAWLNLFWEYINGKMVAVQYMLRPDMVMLLDMSQKVALTLIGQDSKSPISKDWIGPGLGWFVKVPTGPSPSSEWFKS
jgi:hypothetical protein